MDAIKYFFKALYVRAFEEDIFGLSAQLAYFFLLSLFPFLLFTLTFVGYLPIEVGNIMDYIETYAPSSINELINSNIDHIVNNQNGGLLSLSIIATLWAASNGINAIIRVFNRAYEVEENRSFIVSRFIAIVLTLAMIVVIIIALLLPVFGKMIGEYIFAFFGMSDRFITTWGTLRWVMSSIVFFVVFLALYRLAPNKKIYTKNVIWGALFATISWQAVSLMFSHYVSSISNYSATYGSLGTVIALMIWFYISGFIIMIGGIINAVIRKMKLEKVIT
ncbi:YihY/virulence factor BrkB family protein [Lentibacillus saliphilus]|uniref:YihY/virulence factor BrkB family protein n=1 Tax=Lentibacillus saliphilus TaxID=2737028 RepID=UPI001C2FE405|nr:YihY/virulence factor BrkB family protein [Lentibacillus saliphilus]